MLPTSSSADRRQAAVIAFRPAATEFDRDTRPRGECGCPLPSHDTRLYRVLTHPLIEDRAHSPSGSCSRSDTRKRHVLEAIRKRYFLDWDPEAPPAPDELRERHVLDGGVQRGSRPNASAREEVQRIPHARRVSDDVWRCGAESSFAEEEIAGRDAGRLLLVVRQCPRPRSAAGTSNRSSV